MFDKASAGNDRRSRERRPLPRDLEEARIALRCNREELQLLDSFVADGEFESRSELMRAALYAFLRSRALSATPTPRVDAAGLTEVPVRLRPHEVALWEAYAKLVGNDRKLADLFAEAVRQYGQKLGVPEIVAQMRDQVRQAAESSVQEHSLSESGREMERKGWAGR